MHGCFGGVLWSANSLHVRFASPPVGLHAALDGGSRLCLPGKLQAGRGHSFASLRLRDGKFSLLNFGPRFRLGCYMGLGRGLGSVLSDVLLL